MIHDIIMFLGMCFFVAGLLGMFKSNGNWMIATLYMGIGTSLVLIPIVKWGKEK